MLLLCHSFPCKLGTWAFPLKVQEWRLQFQASQADTKMLMEEEVPKFFWQFTLGFLSKICSHTYTSSLAKGPGQYNWLQSIVIHFLAAKRVKTFSRYRLEEEGYMIRNGIVKKEEWKLSSIFHILISESLWSFCRFQSHILFMHSLPFEIHPISPINPVLGHLSNVNQNLYKVYR